MVITIRDNIIIKIALFISRNLIVIIIKISGNIKILKVLLLLGHIINESQNRSIN